ncbi:MAG: terminase [Terracidiphilus sp.]
MDATVPAEAVKQCVCPGSAERESREPAAGVPNLNAANLKIQPLDAAELIRLGSMLDQRPPMLQGETVAMALARILLRVRTKEGKTARLVANAAQRSFEQRRGRHNIVLKARQLGMTTWTAARFFLKTITQPGTLTLQVAHTQQAAEEIFGIVHRFVDLLPEHLRKGPLRTGRANVRQIVFPGLDSQYRVVTAGDRNAGRGLTAQNMHCSELARWPGDPAEILAGLRAALTPEGELILESTPDGIGGCFHELWLKAPETGMVRHFFPWWMESRYRDAAVDAATLTIEESTLIEKQKLDLEQIAFRRKLRADFRGLARQEFAEDDQSCFLASGESIFEIDALDERSKNVSEPVELRKNGDLTVWLPAVADKRYLLAVDPAGGGSDGDYSAIQVLELDAGMQCAEYAGHVGGLELAQIVTDLAREYNRAWVVVERNNHGSGVLAYLESPCGCERIYCQGGRQGGQPGWLTTSLSRPAALGRLGAALVDEPTRFQSRGLLAECRTFVRLLNGNSGARAGTHDDRVMAMAIGLAAREELVGKKSSF